MESVRIEDPSQVAVARRRSQAFASGIGLSEEMVANVGLCTTEVATNILRHATRGEILIERLESDGSARLLVIALDRGPGIANLELAMRDGYSTAGSSGTGLGALKRLSSRLEIFAPHDGGTVLLAEFSDRHSTLRTDRFGAVSIPKFGEVICGDSWAVDVSEGLVSIIVADGLGHGPMASEASMKAIGVLRANPRGDVVDVITEIHGALRQTRGAAVAILQVAEEAEFCGVGNIAAGLYNSVDGKRMVSEIGTAGVVVRRINKYSYPKIDYGLAILASDGLSTGWSMTPYPTLIGHDPVLIAAVLYRDFNRGTDDATVVVVKIGDA